MEERRAVEERLAASLKSLAVLQPFEKITIRQITDGAEVIRATFYNHFQDKYDLLEWIMRTEILDPVKVLLQNRMYREALILIFSSVLCEKDFYTHVVDMEGQNSFQDIVLRSVRGLLHELFSGAAEDGGRRAEHPWLTPDYLSDYYAVSMTFVVVNWIRAGMSIPPEEVTTIYEYIATRSMLDVLREVQGDPGETLQLLLQ